MEGKNRRETIVKILTESDAPISGSKLSKELNVTRQVVVGDIQLLRAGGINIISTASGYVIEKSGLTCEIKVLHKPEDFYDEMCTIVDLGGEVINECIVHSSYGRVVIPLNITNRSEAKVMAEAFLEGSDKPLSELTGGKHSHLIKVKNDVILLRIQKALNEKGYLAK